MAETFLARPHRVLPVRDGASVADMVHRWNVLARLRRMG